MKNENNQFQFDKESNVTLALSAILDANGWNVVACHPPGGHTSFSMLDGRRSKGSYMPDVVAIKFDNSINDHIVIIAESKATYKKSSDDITKLINLNKNHASWIAFRLQNHIDAVSWIENYENKLQKLIAFEEGFISHHDFPEDMIAVQIKEYKVVNKYIGSNAPAHNLFINKTFTYK